MINDFTKSSQPCLSHELVLNHVLVHKQDHFFKTLALLKISFEHGFKFIKGSLVYIAYVIQQHFFHLAFHTGNVLRVVNLVR